jgi:hypothetical protein
MFKHESTVCVAPEPVQNNNYKNPHRFGPHLHPETVYYLLYLENGFSSPFCLFVATKQGFVCLLVCLCMYMRMCVCVCVLAEQTRKPVHRMFDKHAFYLHYWLINIA